MTGAATVGMAYTRGGAAGVNVRLAGWIGACTRRVGEMLLADGIGMRGAGTAIGIGGCGGSGCGAGGSCAMCTDWGGARGGTAAAAEMLLIAAACDTFLALHSAKNAMPSFAGAAETNSAPAAVGGAPAVIGCCCRVRRGRLAERGDDEDDDVGCVRGVAAVPWEDLRPRFRPTALPRFWPPRRRQEYTRVLVDSR